MEWYEIYYSLLFDNLITTFFTILFTTSDIYYYFFTIIYRSFEINSASKCNLSLYLAYACQRKDLCYLTYLVLAWFNEPGLVLVLCSIVYFLGGWFMHVCCCFWLYLELYSLEKLKPEKELQRATSEILRRKLKIRDLFQHLGSLCTEGRLPESLFDSEGEICSEDVWEWFN